MTIKVTADNYDLPHKRECWRCRSRLEYHIDDLLKNEWDSNGDHIVCPLCKAIVKHERQNAIDY